MNERIKELMKQSIANVRFWDADKEDYSVHHNELQKFAELIVQDCIKELEISKKGDIYTGELFNCEWNDCIDSQIAMLKEEFGLDS